MYTKVNQIGDIYLKLVVAIYFFELDSDTPAYYTPTLLHTTSNYLESWRRKSIFN